MNKYFCFDIIYSENIFEYPNILKELGYSYSVIRVNEKQLNKLDENKIIEEFEKEDIKINLMIKVNKNSSAKKYSKKYIVGMEGGNKKLNLQIIKNYNIDVLLNPSEKVKLKDHLHNVSSGINKKLINAKKNNLIFFSIPYTKIFEQKTPYNQALKIRQLCQDLYVLWKTQTPTIITFSSNNIFNLREPEMIINFFEKFSNVSRNWIEKCLSYFPLQLLEIKKHIIPGVKIISRD